MGFFDMFKKEEITLDSLLENQSLLQEARNSKKFISTLLEPFGVVMTDDGNHVGMKTGDLDFIFPKHLLDDSDFLSYYTKQGFNHEAKGEYGRLARYNEYRFMQNEATELDLFVDTIVSETLSYKVNTESLVELRVYNKETGREDRGLSKYLNNRLAELRLDSKQILEGMVVYGDAFLELKMVDKYFETGIFYESPERVFIRVDKNTNIPIGYEITQEFKRTGLEQKHLFEVLRFYISTADSRFTPYGKSLLESSRSPFKKLIILEALLALNRSSKVDKLVVSFPTGASTPEAIMQKAQRVAAQLKGLMIGSGSSPKSVMKPFAFMDILLAPKGVNNNGFEFNRLPSGMDFATIDDVEYFRDKLITGTRMPRAFFKPDEQYQGYRKLSLQDLRFSRLVANLLRDYASTLVIFGQLVLLAEKQTEFDDYRVMAEYKQVSPISMEQLDAVSRGIDLIMSLSNLLRDNVGVEQIPMNTVKDLMSNFTMLTPDVIDMIFSKLKVVSPPKEGEEEDFGEQLVDVKNLYEACSDLREKIAVTGSLIETVSSDDLRYRWPIMPKSKIGTTNYITFMEDLNTKNGVRLGKEKKDV